MNLPNIITLFRIILIPIILVLFSTTLKFKYILVTAIFIIACLTDLLDGYIARLMKQTSIFGEFLDPVADKLIVTIILIMILATKPNMQFALGIPTIIIVGREISMSAIREWMARIGKQSKTRVSSLSKIKTAVQMTAIIILLLSYQDLILSKKIIQSIGVVLIWIAGLLAIITVISYTRTIKINAIDIQNEK